jgi:concentrative nucleoside transporter, CNT family
MQSLQSVLGVVAIIGIAFIISENRREVPWRSVIIGLILTFALALLMLKIPQAAVAAATKAGTAFVFGYVGGAALPFDPKTPGSDFILAFQALPVVLVMSVLSSLLFYWRILPPIVRGFSWALERTLDVGGAAGLSTAANIFVGQVEAPLFIRPYLAKLSRSEMFIVMTGGMAGIAGTVFVLYATILANAIPNAAGHIAVCSVLGAPAAIVISLLMVPDPNRQHTGGRLDDVKQTASGTMDAIVQGTGAGLELLLNIVAMLIVFVALVYLANALLGLLPDFLGSPVTLQRALGWVMAPACWLMGIPWSQVVTAGGLMGIKTVLNELVAYLQLAALPEGALDRVRA